MLKIFTLLICLMFFNTAHAEITQSINPFDNAKIISSQFINKDFKLPRSCIFKKYSNEYTLIMDSKYKSCLITNLEATKLKINEDIYNLYPNCFNDGYRQIISFVIPSQIIDKLPTSSKISFQIPSMRIPVDTDDKNLIQYLIVDIPQNYIEEWKQVINMN